MGIGLEHSGKTDLKPVILRQPRIGYYGILEKILSGKNERRDVKMLLSDREINLLPSE